MKNTYDGAVKLNKIQGLKDFLKDSLKRCAICPRFCKADRAKGVKGYCRAPLNPVVYSYAAHHGEEPPISGQDGSGTIFFSHCNMKCVYCQNYRFSQLDAGREMTIEALARAMMSLKKRGCHNINLVTPTHFMPQILMSLEMALKEGLDIPIVYNTSGYELASMIKLLDGIIDIYLVDMRYSDDPAAKRYSDADRYVEYNRSSVIEMQRQAGDLVIGPDGLAKKGVIIRLLAIPGGVSGTKESLRFIKESVSKNAYLSIMSQYHPAFNAVKYAEISKPLSREEYKNIVDEAHLLGLNNGWVQEEPTGVETQFLGTRIKPGRDIG